MRASRPPADARERERALDAANSFIVQAPAGSGKTELLIQRYLRLLAVVDEPEEILAITFTRKAAGEMRTRIDAAIRAARAGTPRDEPHLRRGYELACAVVSRDRERAWGLGEQPARMRISTIDSVNSSLSRRVPLSAGFTAHNALLEDTNQIYSEAARETLALAEEPDENGAAVRVLLVHFDNNAGLVERLLKAMLGRRDQWLSRTGTGRAAHEGELREWLENTLRELVERFLLEAHRTLPNAEASAFIECLTHAGEYLSAGQQDHAAVVWKGHDSLPEATVADLPLWKGMAACLLTAKGRWRVSITKRDGFPVDDDAQRLRKESCLELLAQLAGEERFRAALEVVAALPEPRYEETQWAIIAALWRVLPLAVALLKQLFAERRQTDYSEVAQEALAALGKPEEVTELRLALDYQIKHVLLDEFQDTSRSQYELITRLTDGWENENDRSVFLVGDPMQSIYRFREADVGLFLETWERQRLGDLPLATIQLTTNFRSDPVIVNWFNHVFKAVFPAHNDHTSGAAKFCASDAYPADEDDFRNCDDADQGDADTAATAVRWHAVPGGDTNAEAARVFTVVRDALACWPDDTIGILIRSRQHAVAIAARLREENIAYVATGLERLHEQPLVQDLLALTRTLTHLGDRLAWLACLRAPWCGLTLADLHLLAADDHDACIWTLSQDLSVTTRLSADGQARLSRCLSILQAGLNRRGSLSLRDLVEATWWQLGGPATIDADDVELADLYFAFLDTLDVNADCIDGVELLDRLGETPVTRGAGDPQVQILTMHRSKGLEFDTVILPGLGRTTRSGDKPLLLFDEILRTDTSTGLVVAPLKASDQAGDPIYDLLWRFETERERFEQDRLLYVAVTRTRRRLHLFAQLTLADSEDREVRPPASNSLLSRLWPVVQHEIETTSVALSVRKTTATGERRTLWREAPLRRLPANWQPPAPGAAFGSIDAQRTLAAEETVEFEWASQWAKHVGSVVHRWLQHIAEEGGESWNAQRVATAEPQLRLALRRAGVARTDMPVAVERALAALLNTLTDQHGCWILSSGHSEISNELAVTTTVDGQFANHVIDRTFVSEDGTRWIVDYKTSIHEGSNLDAFLASEANRYRPQLCRYREAMAELDDRPIRTALYFPLMQAFHEVDTDNP